MAVGKITTSSNRVIAKTVPFWGVDTQTQRAAGTENEGPESQKFAQLDFGRVINKTLGFEKVIVIGLPERSDKRDAMELMASLSGFDVEWVDGVKPSSIPNKAIPVVEEEIGSALIIEDDMDWDIHLKSQLHDIAHGARQILRETSAPPHSPYGDNWDILWLGHCGEPFPETLEENAGLPLDNLAQMSAKYIIHDDETVPPYNEVSQLVDWTQYRPRTRIVHLSAAPICTFAYAVSQRGAKKILYGLSVDGLHMAFDNSLAQLCRDAVYDLGRKQSGGYNMKCLSVNPTIMFHHKPKGLVASGSDIQDLGGDGSVREKGVTESIRWSMRLNLKNILTGKELEVQFQEDFTHRE
ncbi:glycosyltransferase family 25 protein [Trichoderma cornu-damae]|uniref:Glycosyltransferase family 25 protein n=1 Tax=Trichoderma cornu-damae TaxID=654480 RepID=A0A9P8QM60_9HYPO|nr:glycosyltransferase family 25 protein [Trichoderma cornu-damae]